MLEKQALVGGSTAMSGGIAWIPDNPVMRAAGVPDSYEDAMAHFEAVVGDVGPASSVERRHAFLTAGPEMVSFLQDGGVDFVHCPGYSDYYSNAKGGSDVGRGIEPVPFDSRVLGDWLDRLQPGLAKSLGLAVMTNEARALSHYNRSVGAFTTSARVVARTYAAKLRGQALLTNGASLIAQLLRIAISDAPGRASKSWQPRNTLNVPLRSMSTTVRNAFADMPSAGARKLPAAPEMTMSIDPNFSTTVSITPRIAA